MKSLPDANLLQKNYIESCSSVQEEQRGREQSAQCLVGHEYTKKHASAV